MTMLLIAAALMAQPAAAALAPAAAAPAGPVPSAEQQIRAQRDGFNRALAKADLAAIASFLAEDAQIITGNSSLVFNGRAAQIGMWWEDSQAPDPATYVRTPERIELSPTGPMALESGKWSGANRKSKADWASGSYTAKWRRIDGKWLIEAEIYMTTACGGSFCPTPK